MLKKSRVTWRQGALRSHCRSLRPCSRAPHAVVCMNARLSNGGGERPGTRATATAVVSQLSRRGALTAITSTAAWLLPQWLLSSVAVAQKVRSERWDTPTVLTVLNDCVVPVKAYWVNYDGVSELCTILPPGSSWTVETYATHPWRFVNSATGGLLQEWVAEGGHQVLHVSDPATEPQSSAEVLTSDDSPANAEELAAEAETEVEQQVAKSELSDSEVAETAEPEFDGFDGIGNDQEQYMHAKVLRVAMSNMGGVVSLGVEGGTLPLDIYVGVPEAASLYLAQGVELRRPQTSLTWSNTLKAVGAHVDRVLITRMVGETFYARIVLTLPGGEQRSVDSRPSDSLALALQNRAPIYLAKDVAKLLLEGLQGLEPLDADPAEASNSSSAAEKPDAAESQLRPHPPIPAGPRDPYLWMKDAKNA